MIEINISKDYSKTPGGRYRKEGNYSGEDFREKVLIPNYKRAIENGEKLRVTLDGGYGYGSSFLEEAFGGLVRELKIVNIGLFEIISDEEPQLVIDVKNYLAEANTKIGGK